MAIRIKPVQGTYKTKVAFFTPAPGGNGKQEEQSFMAEFRRLTTEEVRDIRGSGKSDLEVLLDVMVGWEASEMGSSETVPFSAEIVTALANDVPGFAAITSLRFLETVGASRQKN